MIRLDTFSDFDSPIHQRDARVRIVAALLLSIALAFAQTDPSIATGLVLALVLVLSARLPIVALARRLVALNLFCALLIGALGMNRTGGWIDGLRIAAKANAILLLCTALIGTLNTVDLGRALGELGLPSKLVQLLFFTVRYIELIGDEYSRLRQAMRMRGFQARLNGHSLRALGHLIGTLFLRSFERSERMLDAMHCRGFRGRFHQLRTRRPIAAADVILSVLGATGAAAIVAMECVWRH